MGKKTTTTIGLPITEKPQDQKLFRRLEKLKAKRNIRKRTDLLRLLINEEAERCGL